MQRFTELQVWQRGHSLVLSVYRMTTGFPQNERYGLEYVTPIVATKSFSEISELSRMLHALRKKVEAAGVHTRQ